MAASDMRSPPARPTFHDRLGILSSSPSLPDLQDLIATKSKPKPQTLRSGSAAVPIPENASTVFTSASDILRAARAKGNESPDVIDEPELPVAKTAAASRVRTTVTEPKATKQPRAAKVARPGRASKRVAKEIIVLSSDGVIPELPRHVESAAAETGEQNANVIGTQSNDGTPLQAKPWKKFKAASSPEQTELGAEATSAKPPAKAKLQKKKGNSETVSSHFSKAKEPVESEKHDATEKRPRVRTPEPINLEFAVQRRSDWTPAKAATLVPGAFDPTQDDDNGLDAAHLFKNLRDTYGHKVADAGVVTAPKQQTAKVLGKRKVIEMVSVNLSSKSTEASREPSPAKAKAAKKKPRTITELATAAYAPKVAGEDDPRDESLLEYFSVEGPKQGASKGVAIKITGKPAKVTKSKKKAPPKKPMLLSPQSAMRQSAAQDFVFGTASQLAREKSPTFWKDLHTAIKASTIDEEDEPFANPSTGDLSKSKMRGKRLWSVSARDEEGDLVDVEMIDLINSPTLPQDDAILDPWTQLPPEAADVETETADSSVIEVASRTLAAHENKSSLPLMRKGYLQKMTINTLAALPPDCSDESFPLVTELLEDEMPPPSNQQQTQEEVRDSPSKATAPPASTPRPKYETFTDVKLAKEISKFGFKAVKTRTGMIALLDQCWERKARASVAGASFSTSSLLASPKRKQGESAVHPSTTSTSPVKKPRGRAKKTVSADIDLAESSTGTRTQKGPVAEEVLGLPKKQLDRRRKDTASSMPPPPTPGAKPSTPKRKKAASQADHGAEDSDLDSEIGASGSSPAQLFSPFGSEADIAESEDTEISLNFSPTAQQSTLFNHITEAVTSAPRTTDPENPSWHEKMLMYDPIILEELTSWLNSGELTRLGYDDEVAPQDVKKWCESRSVCCLWKGNWHGKERKRF